MFKIKTGEEPSAFWHPSNWEAEQLLRLEDLSPILARDSHRKSVDKGGGTNNCNSGGNRPVSETLKLGQAAEWNGTREGRRDGRVARVPAGEQSWRRGKVFETLNLWLIKQLHHLAAEFWQGV